MDAGRGMMGSPKIHCTHLARKRERALSRHLSYDRTPEALSRATRAEIKEAQVETRYPRIANKREGASARSAMGNNGGAAVGAQVTQHKSLRVLAPDEAWPCLTNWCSIAALKPTGTQARFSMARWNPAGQ